MKMPNRRHKYYITQEVSELVYDIIVRDCEAHAYDKYDFVNWFFGCQGYHNIAAGGCGRYYTLKNGLEFACLPTGWLLTFDFSICHITKTMAKEAQQKIDFLFARNWNETTSKDNL